MYYRVYPVEGATDPWFRSSRPNLNEVPDEIASVYEMAAHRGGQVIAGHTLKCSVDVGSAGPESGHVEMDVLFLVMELPGEPDDGVNLAPVE